MILAIFLFLLGLGILIFGAEFLIKGAASLAKKIGISPLIIGLTIVAFGTSAPELVVNIISAYQGNDDIALGNIIGSNIANILLILGASAIIRPLKIHINTVTKEIPFALLAMILVFIMGNDILIDGATKNTISRIDGFSLIAIFGIFLTYIFLSIKKESKEKRESQDETVQYSGIFSSIFIITGLTGLIVGGKMIVVNAVQIAAMIGMSETVIGLTIVAIGTSLPELATSIIATKKGHDDIAIGNAVGSNIFNIFWILGVTALTLQMPFEGAINQDVIIGIIATFALFLAMFIGKKHQLERWQGIIFLLGYIVYTTYLVIR